MATLPEIALRLATFIEAVLLPGGQRQPSAIPGYVGQIVVFENYPVSAELDRIVANNGIAVAVTPMGDAVATKRFPVVDYDMGRTSPPITATVAGTAVTFSGQPVSPLNISVVVDSTRAYVLPVASNATLPSLATALAAQVSSLYPGSAASGASFSVAGANTIEVRLGFYVNTRREIGRQLSHFRVTVWCQDDGLRNQTVTLIRSTLDDRRRFTDLDGWGVNIRSGREVPVLDALRQGWARTEILYPVEFGITTGALLPSCVFLLVAQSAPSASVPATIVYTPDPKTGIDHYLDAAAQNLASVHAAIVANEAGGSFGPMSVTGSRAREAAVSPVAMSAIEHAGTAVVSAAHEDRHHVPEHDVVPTWAAETAAALNPETVTEADPSKPSELHPEPPAAVVLPAGGTERPA